MSSHDDLNQQWREAAARDTGTINALSGDEIDTGAHRVATWGDRWREDVLAMEDNERRMVVLLAALLDASPVGT